MTLKFRQEYQVVEENTDDGTWSELSCESNDETCCKVEEQTRPGSDAWIKVGDKAESDVTSKASNTHRMVHKTEPNTKLCENWTPGELRKTSEYMLALADRKEGKVSVSEEDRHHEKESMDDGEAKERKAKKMNDLALDVLRFVEWTTDLAGEIKSLICHNEPLHDESSKLENPRCGKTESIRGGSSDDLQVESFFCGWLFGWMCGLIGLTLLGATFELMSEATDFLISLGSWYSETMSTHIRF